MKRLLGPGGAPELSAQPEPLSVRSRLALAVAHAGNLALFALFALLLWRYLLAAEGQIDSFGLPVGRDFMVFWSSAVLAADVGALALFDPTALQALWAERFDHWDATGYSWAHPPQMLFVIAPLARLDYLWALAAWSLAGLGAYALATRRMALLAAPATFRNLFIGQTGFWVGALYFGALRLAARRPLLAGVLCGLIAIKPHLGLMIPIALIAARAWRIFLGAALTVGALALLSALAFGWEAWRLWLLQALPHQTSMLYGVLGSHITVSVFMDLTMLGLPAWGAWLAQAPATGFAAWATWRAFSRLRRGRARPSSAVAVLLLSTCVATPYLFIYDLTLVSPVALHALAEWRHEPWTRDRMRLANLGVGVMWLLVWLLPVKSWLPGGYLPIGSAVLLAALGLSVWRLNKCGPA